MGLQGQGCEAHLQLRPHKRPRSRLPTQKPLRLLRRAVLASAAEGDLVFDPFCGSGTTGVAAKELGRFFAGTEAEREYAQLAGRRIGAVVRKEELQELSSLPPTPNRGWRARVRRTAACRGSARSETDG